MTIVKVQRHTNKLRTKAVAFATVFALGTTVVLGGVASALASTNTSGTSTTNTQTLQKVISRGDAEITRRLGTLNTLTSKINAATKLSASDKATLTAEVSSTISGLDTLKTQLDSETTLAAAKTDVSNMYSEYRVYALVAPKVGLVKVADDQQVAESKLSALATKLQTRITADQNAGKDVTALQSDLTDMTTKTSAAQTISSNIESSVINLQPSDYNSNHSVLEGDKTQLQTAHADNEAAYTDAKNIVSGLKSL